MPGLAKHVRRLRAKGDIRSAEERRVFVTLVVCATSYNQRIYIIEKVCFAHLPLEYPGSHFGSLMTIEQMVGQTLQSEQTQLWDERGLTIGSLQRVNVDLLDAIKPESRIGWTSNLVGMSVKQGDQKLLRPAIALQEAYYSEENVSGVGNSAQDIYARCRASRHACNMDYLSRVKGSEDR
ncbi:hypothetical protein B0J17DRAFT_702327 [Rhizoctonia solani]|nr:hypothetical protein B0J17DRAFT_702327 [Rhizoctonia solani]